jgi:hypothetical protein
MHTSHMLSGVLNCSNIWLFQNEYIHNTLPGPEIVTLFCSGNCRRLHKLFVSFMGPVKQALQVLLTAELVLSTQIMSPFFSNLIQTFEFVIRLFNRCKMTNRCVKKLVDFINMFQILPRHVSASGCHLQSVVGAL